MHEYGTLVHGLVSLNYINLKEKTNNLKHYPTTTINKVERFSFIRFVYLFSYIYSCYNEMYLNDTGLFLFEKENMLSRPNCRTA